MKISEKDIKGALAPGDVQKACRYKDKKGKQLQPDWRDPPNGKSYFPSYNIAPGAYTPVLLSSDHFTNKDTTVTTARVIQPMRWGLVPSWHKGSEAQKAFETNNCRAESMLEKQTYKVPLQKGRRCVILAEGFYEWKRSKDAKQPYYIFFPQSGSKDQNENHPGSETKVKVEGQCEQSVKVKVEDDTDTKVKVEACDDSFSEDKVDLDLENMKVKFENRKDSDNSTFIKEIKREPNSKMDHGPRLLTMAGVFDVWKPPGEAEPVYSYSVITVESSDAMSWIHHRMPAMLETDDEIEQWLDFGDVPLNKAVGLIRPTHGIEMYPVSTVVNNSRHNTPDCVKKIDPSKPKPSASSHMMMSWLIKGDNKPSGEQPPEKKSKIG